MHEHNEQLLEYIESHHLQGVAPEALREQLVQAGWDASQTEAAIRHVIEKNSGLKGKKKKKVRPPIAAMILYVLGFLGLLGGLLIAVLAIAWSARNDFSSVFSLFGISSLGVTTAAIIFAAIVIGLFVLIHNIRYGSKTALFAYSFLIGLSFLVSLMDYVTMSEFERLFNNQSFLDSLFPYIIVGPLLIILWTRNKDYFQ